MAVFAMSVIFFACNNAKKSTPIVNDAQLENVSADTTSIGTFNNLPQTNDNKKSLRKVKFGTLLKVIFEATEVVTQRLVLVDPKNTIRTCFNCQELVDSELTL